MIFILATMVFFIMRILPGDPVTSALGPKGTPEMIQHIRANAGLERSNDRPIWPFLVEHGHSALREFAGGWTSSDHRRDERTLSGNTGIDHPCLSPGFVHWGIWRGFGCLQTQKKPLDFSLRIYSVVIYSLPIFWFGLMLQLFFGVRLEWLPISGRIDRDYRHDPQNSYQYL